MGCAGAGGARRRRQPRAERFRISRGIPRFGVDIRERDLPQETGQTRALNFTKGCYLGQEIVERIRSRGAVHRQFTAFTVEGALPEPGTKILAADEKEVGEITSSAILPLAGGDRPVALGLSAARGCGKRVARGSGEAETGSAADRLNFRRELESRIRKTYGSKKKRRKRIQSQRPALVHLRRRTARFHRRTGTLAIGRQRTATALQPMAAPTPVATVPRAALTGAAPESDVPEPPTASEQQAQHDAYKQSSRDWIRASNSADTRPKSSK